MRSDAPRYIVLLFMALSIASGGKGVNHYFPKVNQPTIHIYSPDNDSADPLYGIPIPPVIGEKLGLPREEGLAPTEVSYFGLMRVSFGKRALLYIVREPGTYDSSVIGLYRYDDRQNRLNKIQDLADYLGDAGDIYEKDSWLIDVNDDGHLDIVTKELFYGDSAGDEGGVAAVEKKTEVMLFENGSFKLSCLPFPRADSLRLKHEESLWQSDK